MGPPCLPPSVPPWDLSWLRTSLEEAWIHPEALSDFPSPPGAGHRSATREFPGGRSGPCGECSSGISHPPRLLAVLSESEHGGNSKFPINIRTPGGCLRPTWTGGVRLSTVVSLSVHLFMLKPRRYTAIHRLCDEVSGAEAARAPLGQPAVAPQRGRILAVPALCQRDPGTRQEALPHRGDACTTVRMHVHAHTLTHLHSLRLTQTLTLTHTHTLTRSCSQGSGKWWTLC